MAPTKKTKGRARSGWPISSAQTGLVRSPTSPPTINDSFLLRKIFRFQAVAAFSATAIQPMYIRDLLLTVLTATTATCFMNAARIRKISMWAAAATSGATPVTISLEAGTSGNTGQVNSTRLSDTSMDLAHAAHLAFVPPPKSVMDFWLTMNSGLQIFNMTGPAGTIIDLEIELRVDDNLVVAPGSAPVAATAGQLAYRGLDGAPIATTNFTPIGVTFTV